MERAEWLFWMNVERKLLAMADGFTRAREHLKKSSRQRLGSTVPPAAPAGDSGKKPPALG
jgi:hypothetical protein